MSVRTGDRSEGKITAVDASRLLIDYTYDRVHDKTLPKSDRWLIANANRGDAFYQIKRMETYFKQLERSNKNGNDAGKTSQN